MITFNKSDAPEAENVLAEIKNVVVNIWVAIIFIENNKVLPYYS